MRSAPVDRGFARLGLALGLHLCFCLALIGCSPASDDSAPEKGTGVVASPATPDEATASVETTSSTAPVGRGPAGQLDATNIFESERDWPNIVALAEPWTPPGTDAPLKKGYRGAMIRLDEGGRVRIDFGRHGKHDVPLDSTDLIERANDVRAGILHKTAPNFLAHFGTQFAHPTAKEGVAFPTPELAKAELFLCVFADPRETGFESIARALAAAGERPRLQMLLFPLSLEQDDFQLVKDRLSALAWPVPFAYPRAAEVHARSLLGRVPATPWALLVTPEGRLVFESPLDEVGSIEAILAAAVEQAPGSDRAMPPEPAPASEPAHQEEAGEAP